MSPLPKSEMKAKVLHAARDNGSGKEYSIREIGRAQFHLKCGHLTHNIMCGACAQAYKFDVSLVDVGKIHVVSRAQCGGYLGGAIGVCLEDEEYRRMRSTLRREFPGRIVC
jgi:hypothetical protein